MIKEKHGAVVGMVVLNAERKICSMMLTSFTMRTTKRLVNYYKVVILVDLQLIPSWRTILPKFSTYDETETVRHVFLFKGSIMRRKN